MSIDIKTHLARVLSEMCKKVGLLALTCDFVLGDAGVDVGLGELKGGPLRPAALWQPSQPPSDFATQPEQSASSHTAPGALHATCTCKPTTSCGAVRLSSAGCHVQKLARSMS